MPLPQGVHGNRKYYDPSRCRQRAYRARVEQAAREAGVAPTVCLSRIQEGPRVRHRYAKTGRRTRKADQRVSLAKAEQAIRDLRQPVPPAADPRTFNIITIDEAIEAVRSALPKGARHGA